jgi:aspartate/methionine/tyrosine aminotransferase
MFSSRTPSTLGPNPLAAAIAGLRAAGVSPIDLTVSNPTVAGLPYPPGLLAGLAAPEAQRYAPDPLGWPAARQAIAAARRGEDDVQVPWERIALTASTSEAYAVLFKLLCEAGDEVLVAQPSYPLFEHLARLELVRVVPYALRYDGRWAIDVHDLDRAWSDRTRAVIVVTPNNPTGSLLRRDDLERLVARCASRGAALICDEVFAAYPLEPFADGVSRVIGRDDPPALTFALDGLSKSCGLPQVKLGWITVGGPAALVDTALARLELILDTYLSVNTPVQIAAAGLLASGGAVREAIRARTRENLATARALLSHAPACDLLRVEGGWSAVVRVPATAPEEQIVLGLLAEEQVLVHPGYFFDFPHEAFLVVSLLPPPAVFAEGLARVVRRAGIA